MKKTMVFAAAAALLASCQVSVVDITDADKLPTDELLPINLSMGVDTKVTDTEYEYGDRVGIFVVNQPNSLDTYDNHYTNMEFTYNGSWSPAERMFWYDKITPADFYCYYPYTSYVSNVYEHDFTVAADQRDLNALKSSDFAWGKLTNVYPTNEVVNVNTNHILSSIKVYLEPGDGFTWDALNSADIKVSLRNMMTTARINLAEGSVYAVGGDNEMTLYHDGDHYCAVVVPQDVYDWEEFIVINVNGSEYKLKKNFTFRSGKRHKFTVKVNKTGNGVNVGIGGWEEDEEDNGGTAE